MIKLIFQEVTGLSSDTNIEYKAGSTVYSTIKKFQKLGNVTLKKGMF
jgi:hypothetical protein